MRIIAQYSKTGVAKYISHLDLQRAMGRALRRANIDVKFSQGFNPHIVLSFASALGVGISSSAEMMDVSLAIRENYTMSAQEFCEKMNAVLPIGLKINQAFLVDDNYFGLSAITTDAKYNITIEYENKGDIDHLSFFQQALQQFLKFPIMIKKKGKAGIKDVDLQEFLTRLEIVESQEDSNKIKLELDCKNSSKGSLNPLFLMPKILLGFELSEQTLFNIERVALLNIVDQQPKQLWELEKTKPVLNN